MKKGKKKVYQVTKNGELVEDYDTSLSPKEMEEKLKEVFDGLEKVKSNPAFYIGEYKGNRYAIRCKNVTYLGNPHPLYKKRIQIADDLHGYYQTAKELGREPLLMGIYTFQDNTIFVNFGIDTYINKSAHNSSAHVYSSDLMIATEEGFFEKTDFFGNTITAFVPDTINVFFDEIFSADTASEKDVFKLYSAEHHDVPKESVTDEESEIGIPNHAQLFSEKIIPEFKAFFENENPKWNGIDCYKKMIDSGYRNKFQPEWAGFYLEYEFEKYLDENNLKDDIQYYQDKSKDGIDLDLYFPQIDSYGDLKAHSENSRGIQGNDWETVFSIINDPNKNNHIYYIVCEHATEKDSEYNYEVTKFWNQRQNKKNLMSYHKRMKNNVTLKKVYFLDINDSNYQYLSVFKQGINSNGKPRAPKIMIEQDNIKYFLMDEISL